MVAAAANAKPPLGEDQLSNWKLLQQFQRRLAPRLVRAGASAAADHRLNAGDYLSFQLFALLNPALKSARSLGGASRFKHVQQEVCRQPVKLASLSERQHVCDPALLAGLLRDLAVQAQPTFGEAGVRQKVGELIASVLLVLWTGRKPTKRQWEALQLYWLGWASLEELTEVLTPQKQIRLIPRGGLPPSVAPGAASPHAAGASPITIPTTTTTTTGSTLPLLIPARLNPTQLRVRSQLGVRSIFVVPRILTIHAPNTVTFSAAANLT